MHEIVPALELQEHRIRTGKLSHGRLSDPASIHCRVGNHKPIRESLADAEAGEDAPEQVVARHLAGDLPKRLVRVAQFLRDQFARMPRGQQFMRRFDMRARASQRIDVPGSRRERAVRCGMKADAVLEVLTQPVEARTRTGAQVDPRRIALPCLDPGRRRRCGRPC